MNITCKFVIASVIALVLAFAVDGIVSGKFFPERDDRRYYDSYGGSNIGSYDNEEEAAHVDPRCDLTNLTDPDTYFKDNDPIFNDDHEVIVSHNEFYLADGTLAEMNITSAGYGYDENGNMVFSGKKYLWGYGANTPCAYDSSVTSAVSFTHNGHFALLFDDYNNDNEPDFVIRVSDYDPQAGNGAFYYLTLINPGYEYTHTGVAGVSLSTPKGYADRGFFVYGETADAIRLGHIRRDVYFFLTLDRDDNVIPMAFNSRGNSVSCDEYILNGMIFTSHYEKGCLEITAANTLYEQNSCEAHINIKRLDGKVWRDENVSFEYNFTPWILDSQTAYFPMEPEKGLYRAEITVDGEYNFTEFYVR